MNNQIIGISTILAISLFISIGCILIIYKNFKKSNLNKSKNFKKDLKITFANSFFSSSLFSIITACIIYVFLEKILTILNLSTGLINYCTFVAKIWFISSPFIGLELVIFAYFFTLNYYRKPIIILIYKFIIYLIISLLYYQTRKFNCFIYAKPVCDIIFLVYYSKICFDITLKK